MLVCRRLLLIAAAIAASIEAGSTSYYPSISSSDYSGYPNGGYAVHSGATSPESSPSSSSSTSGPTSELAASNTESVCRPSEFRCSTTGHCVAQDKYCDGENDCDDKSDEPRYCTREYLRERTETSNKASRRGKSIRGISVSLSLSLSPPPFPS